MSSAARNLESGPQGTVLELDVYFYDTPGGNPVDDDGFAGSGTLPHVQIKDPDGTVVADSVTDPSPVLPVRVRAGEYTYDYGIPIDAEISSSWQIIWVVTINGETVTATETFSVTPDASAPAYDFTKVCETRIGFKFRNPDTTSSTHYPNWGQIVTPDELRFFVMGSTRLVHPGTGYTFDDAHLNGLIHGAISLVEKDLSISILPRMVRYGGYFNSTTGEWVERESVATELANLETLLGPRKNEAVKFLIRESGYEYNDVNASRYLYIKLNERPLYELKGWSWVGPVGLGDQALSNQTIVEDLRPFVKNYKHQYPDYEAAIQAYIGPSVLTRSIYPYSAPFLGNSANLDGYPDAFRVDYDIGHKNAAQVPDDLRELVYFLSGIFIMEDFGDAQSPGIASASIGLNSISESYSTTQSATNALYGARITYYKDHIKMIEKTIRKKYNTTYMVVL